MRNFPARSERRPIPGPPVTSRLAEERDLPAKQRRRLLAKIGRELGMTAVSYFTSFRYPVMIEQGDADMLEDVLQHADLSSGLCLIVNSPGGDALAAERIVRICRTYSREKFAVLVPRRAKSAATMIALGAGKIWMTDTSELGPIGTQRIFFDEEGNISQMSAHAIIKTYDDLMEKAAGEEGHVEPYLIQLQRYDAAEVEELRANERLAKDIAIRWLQEGMMKGVRRNAVGRRISLFIDPGRTHVHGRGIFYDEATRAGLDIELIETGSSLYQAVVELCQRTEQLVSGQASKAVESIGYHFFMPAPVFAPLERGSVGTGETPGE